MRLYLAVVLPQTDDSPDYAEHVELPALSLCRSDGPLHRCGAIGKVNVLYRLTPIFCTSLIDTYSKAGIAFGLGEGEGQAIGSFCDRANFHRRIAHGDPWAYLPVERKNGTTTGRQANGMTITKWLTLIVNVRFQRIVAVVVDEQKIAIRPRLSRTSARSKG